MKGASSIVKKHEEEKRTIVKSTFFSSFFFFNMYKKTKYACLLLSLLRLIWPRNKHWCMCACVEQERRLKRIKNTQKRKRKKNLYCGSFDVVFLLLHTSLDHRKHPIKMKNKLMIMVIFWKKKRNDRRIDVRSLPCEAKKYLCISLARAIEKKVLQCVFEITVIR